MDKLLEGGLKNVGKGRGGAMMPVVNRPVMMPFQANLNAAFNAAALFGFPPNPYVGAAQGYQAMAPGPIRAGGFDGYGIPPPPAAPRVRRGAKRQRL